MTKSLAELRAQPPAPRPERPHTMCLATHLIGEFMSLTDELETLDRQRAEAAAAASSSGGPRTGRPARSGEGAEHPRVAAIRARMLEIADEMEEYEGVLVVRAVKTEGEWRNWANAHPGREEGEDGHARDQEVTFGFCNADDLIDDLATYAVKWNGEDLAPGDWDEHIAPDARLGDKKKLARLVVGMYESDVDIPKLRAGLSANLRRDAASVQPSRPADPPASSTDESPQNDTSTTPPTES